MLKIINILGTEKIKSLQEAKLFRH